MWFYVNIFTAISIVFVSLAIGWYIIWGRYLKDVGVLREVLNLPVKKKVVRQPQFKLYRSGYLTNKRIRDKANKSNFE